MYFFQLYFFIFYDIYLFVRVRVGHMYVHVLSPSFELRCSETLLFVYLREPPAAIYMIKVIVTERINNHDGINDVKVKKNNKSIQLELLCPR